MLLARSITYTFLVLCSLWVISCQIISKPFQSSRIKELASYCDTVIDTFVYFKLQRASDFYDYNYQIFNLKTQDFYYTPCQEQQNKNINLKDSVKLCEDELYIWLSPITGYYNKHTIHVNASKKQHRKQLIDPKRYSDFVIVKQGDLFWSDGCQWRVDSVNIDRPIENELHLGNRKMYMRFILVDCLQEFKNNGQCKCAVKRGAAFFF